MSVTARAFPATLSGGEQQRIAIARALSPFAGLDARSVGDVRSAVVEAADAHDSNYVLLVTHDTRAAMTQGRRI